MLSKVLAGWVAQHVTGGVGRYQLLAQFIQWSAIVVRNCDDVSAYPCPCLVFLCVRRWARGRRLAGRTASVCHDRVPKPCSQTNELPVEYPNAVCTWRCAAALASVRESDWQAECTARLVGWLSRLFLAAKTTPIRPLSSQSQEPRSCAFRQARVGGLLAKPDPRWTCIVRRCGKSKIAKPVQQFAQVRSRVPQRLDRLERVGETVPAGGRRHELGYPLGSLGADRPRVEAALLPDHSRKELDRQRVLRGRLL
jgi:hypothetical protein